MCRLMAPLQLPTQFFSTCKPSLCTHITIICLLPTLLSIGNDAPPNCRTRYDTYLFSTELLSQKAAKGDWLLIRLNGDAEDVICCRDPKWSVVLARVARELSH